MRNACITSKFGHDWMPSYFLVSLTEAALNYSSHLANVPSVYVFLTRSEFSSVTDTNPECMLESTSADDASVHALLRSTCGLLLSDFGSFSLMSYFPLGVDMI